MRKKIVVFDANGRHEHMADTWLVQPETDLLTIFCAADHVSQPVAVYREWNSVQFLGDE